VVRHPDALVTDLPGGSWSDEAVGDEIVERPDGVFVGCKVSKCWTRYAIASCGSGS